MVGFNQAWAADFYNVESLPTDFRDKPTGLDGHHVGTKSNVTSHPDINVRRLLRELGTRLETFTDESGQVSKRSFFDTGNSADNFIGLPSTGTNGISGGQPVHFDRHPAATAFSKRVDSEALAAYSLARMPVDQGGLGLDHISALDMARDVKVGYANAEKMLLLGAYKEDGLTGTLDSLYANPDQLDAYLRQTDAFKAGYEKGLILDLSMKGGGSSTFDDIIDPRVRAGMDASTIDQRLTVLKTAVSQAANGGTPPNLMRTAAQQAQFEKAHNIAQKRVNARDRFAARVEGAQTLLGKAVMVGGALVALSGQATAAGKSLQEYLSTDALDDGIGFAPEFMQGVIIDAGIDLVISAGASAVGGPISAIAKKGYDLWQATQDVEAAIDVLDYFYPDDAFVQALKKFKEWADSPNSGVNPSDPAARAKAVADHKAALDHVRSAEDLKKISAADLSKVGELVRSGEIPANVADDFIHAMAKGTVSPFNPAHVQAAQNVAPHIGEQTIRQFISSPDGLAIAPEGVNSKVATALDVIKTINEALAQQGTLEERARGLALRLSSTGEHAAAAVALSLRSGDSAEKAWQVAQQALTTIQRSGGPGGSPQLGVAVGNGLIANGVPPAVAQLFVGIAAQQYTFGSYDRTFDEFISDHNQRVGAGGTGYAPSQGEILLDIEVEQYSVPDGASFLGGSSLYRQGIQVASTAMRQTDNGVVRVLTDYSPAGSPNPGTIEGTEYAWSERSFYFAEVDGSLIGEDVVVAPGLVVSRTKDQSIPAAQQVWETQILTPVDYFNEQTLEGAAIGSIFGAALSQAIPTDNVFQQVAATSVLSAIGKNFGQLVQGGLAGNTSMSEVVELTLADFGTDVAAAFQTQALGAISGFLMGELAEALGFDGSGFGDQLLRSSLGSITQTVLQNAAQQSDLFSGLFIGGVDAAAISPTTLAAGVGSFIGGYVARQIVSPENLGGAIGGAIGGGLGSLAGVAAIGSIGSTILASVGISTLLTTTTSIALGIILPGIGAFIGTALGTLIGNLWDEGLMADHGKGDARARLGAGEAEFVETTVTGKDNDFLRPARETRNAIVSTVNQFLGAVGGIAANSKPLVLRVLMEAEEDGWFNTKHYFFYEIYEEEANGSLTRQFKSGGTGRNWTPQEWVEKATLSLLEYTNIFGGNIFMKRALASSQATTLAGLSGDLKIAEDYSRYLANRPLIDALIALDPESAFAAGWIVSILRAEELGLDQVNASDFTGGLAGFIASFDPRRSELVDAEVTAAIENNELVITFTPKSGGEPYVTKFANFAALTGLQALSAGGAAVTGTSAADFWAVTGAAGRSFVDAAGAASNDALMGGAGNDTIHAGAGNDFVNGGAGNDVIEGGAGLDVLFGGEGDDAISGGAGTDILSGGRGNDALSGGEGDDTYLFGRGDGVDTVFDSAGDADVVVFGRGIAVSDLLLEYAGDDLIIGLKIGTAQGQTASAAADRLIIQDWRLEPSRIERLAFSDGSSLDVLALLELAPPPSGTVVAIGGTASGHVSGTAGADTITSAAGSEVIQAGDGDDVVFGNTARDIIDGGAGTDRISFANLNGEVGVSVSLDLGTAVKGKVADTLRNFENVTGSAQADAITGSSGANVLDGGAGDDTLAGLGGNDTIIGGAGNDIAVYSGIRQEYGVVRNADGSYRIDHLNGGANGIDLVSGVEKFHFDDVVVKAADLINLAPTAAPDVATVSEDRSITINPFGNDSDPDGDSLKILSGKALRGTVTISNNRLVYQGASNYNGTDTITYTIHDGKGGRASSHVSVTINPVNDAPVAHGIAAQSSAEDALWTFTVPQGAFSDVESDTLTYSATLASGSALPAWLSFNAATRTFSGTPPVNFNGAIDLRVRAQDPAGLSSLATFLLNVTPVNDAPVLERVLVARNSNEDVAINFTIPSDFDDIDGDVLTYSAGLADGSPLPAWLLFNTSTRRFTGTPPPNYNGVLNVRVSASDPSGLSASGAFVLTIAPVNDAPIAHGIAAQSSPEDAAWTFTVPPGAFTEVEGEAITYTATLNTGAALPAWLTFNGATRTFSGTPPVNFNGPVNLRVRAQDPAGLFVTSDFVLTVSPVNDAPVLAQALVARTSNEDTAISFVVPVTSFTDIDADVLSYTALLTDGSPLPGWLLFNGTTRAFTGTPPANFNGVLSVRVTARDVAGAEAWGAFALTIAPVNDAPIAHGIAAQSSPEDAAWTFTVPPGAFTEVEGEAITYTATLNTGAALPAWLTFNGATRTFSGTPPVNFNGAIDLRVRAQDPAGLSSLATFRLNVTPVNDAPFVEELQTAGTFVRGVSNTLTLNGELFDDIEGDSLTWSSRLADGSPLPSWLVFNAALRRFTGIPPSNSVETIAIHVLATDPSGGSATTEFRLAVREAGRTVNGTSAADVLAGGNGNDVLNGSRGNDTYLFGRGSGQDTIFDNGNLDQLSFATGIGLNDLRFETSGSTLFIGIRDYTAWGQELGASQLSDRVGITNFTTTYSVIERLTFVDGTTVDATLIRGALSGTAGNDILTGTATAEIISGGSGADTLTGGAGRDILIGGAGNDTYGFNRGDQQDRIYEFDTNQSDLDRVLFGSTIGMNDVWFQRVENDLRVSLLATADTLTVSDWYLDASRRTDQFALIDGKTLHANSVDLLVSAMAAFTPSTTSSGSGVKPTTIPTSVQLAIGSSWA